jgi:CRP-like cAMP-binding protein
MADPTDHDDETVTVPLSDLRRLMALNERLARAVERLLNRHEHQARRAANLAGPTTPEAEARVARKLKKLGAM